MIQERASMIMGLPALVHSSRSEHQLDQSDFVDVPGVTLFKDLTPCEQMKRLWRAQVKTHEALRVYQSKLSILASSDLSAERASQEALQATECH